MIGSVQERIQSIGLCRRGPGFTERYRYVHVYAEAEETGSAVAGRDHLTPMRAFLHAPIEDKERCEPATSGSTSADDSYSTCVRPMRLISAEPPDRSLPTSSSVCQIHPVCPRGRTAQNGGRVLAISYAVTSASWNVMPVSGAPACARHASIASQDSHRSKLLIRRESTLSAVMATSRQPAARRARSIRSRCSSTNRSRSSSSTNTSCDDPHHCSRVCGSPCPVVTSRVAETHRPGDDDFRSAGVGLVRSGLCCYRHGPEPSSGSSSSGPSPPGRRAHRECGCADPGPRITRLSMPHEGRRACADSRS
jgi:hypothetical protein